MAQSSLFDLSGSVALVTARDATWARAERMADRRTARSSRAERS